MVIYFQRMHALRTLAKMEPLVKARLIPTFVDALLVLMGQPVWIKVFIFYLHVKVKRYESTDIII